MRAFIKHSGTRYTLAGPVFWIVSVQYFVTQIFVASVWSRPYSVRFNTISDLGNTACGQYRDSLVCSPAHTWMNASFIALGCTMIVGAILLCHQLHRSPKSAIGFGFMGLAGLGTALVGLFPENTISAAHIFGAALTFLFGNLALLILGSTLCLPGALRYYTIGSGVIALAALGLFLGHSYLGLGIGGMERVTAYPQTIWLTVFGIYVVYSHSRPQA